MKKILAFALFGACAPSSTAPTLARRPSLDRTTATGTADVKAWIPSNEALHLVAKRDGAIDLVENESQVLMVGGVVIAAGLPDGSIEYEPSVAGIEAGTVEFAPFLEVGGHYPSLFATVNYPTSGGVGILKKAIYRNGQNWSGLKNENSERFIQFKAYPDGRAIALKIKTTGSEDACDVSEGIHFVFLDGKAVEQGPAWPRRVPEVCETYQWGLEGKDIVVAGGDNEGYRWNKAEATWKPVVARRGFATDRTAITGPDGTHWKIGPLRRQLKDGQWETVGLPEGETATALYSDKRDIWVLAERVGVKVESVFLSRSRANAVYRTSPVSAPIGFPRDEELYARLRENEMKAR